MLEKALMMMRVLEVLSRWTLGGIQSAVLPTVVKALHHSMDLCKISQRHQGQNQHSQRSLQRVMQQVVVQLLGRFQGIKLGTALMSG